MTPALTAPPAAVTPAIDAAVGAIGWDDIRPGDEIRLPSFYSSDGWHHESCSQRVDRITAAVAYHGPMSVLTTQLGGPQIIHGGRLGAGCLRTYTSTAPTTRVVTASTNATAR